MLKSLSLAIVLALTLTACASAQEGDSCKQGTGTCESDATALICDKGDTLRLFHCRGTGGCTETKDNGAICVFGTFQAGDACPQSVEGGGQCDPANANQALLCNSGTMQAQTCKGCALQAGKIVCQP